MYTLQMFKGVNAERDYLNVRWFTSLSQQEAYFGGLANVTFTNCTPIKDNGGFYVEGNVNDYRTYSYMRYWYNDKKKVYCFIDSVEYVNEHVFKVNYTIDSFQTYMTEIQVTQCFVEREHVTDDTIGAHTLSESIPIAPYIVNTTKEVPMKTDRLVIGSTKDLTDYSSDVEGGCYNGIYRGYKYYCYNIGSEDGKVKVRQVIRNIYEKGISDSIVEMFLSSSSIIGEVDADGALKELSSARGEIVSFDLPKSLNGYTPRNNKLLCYPYCCIRVRTSQGQSVEYEPQRFTTRLDNTNAIELNYVVNSGTQAIATMAQYNGLMHNSESTLSLPPFPSCSLASDPYATWLNQNTGSATMGALAQVAQGAASGGFIGSMIPIAGTAVGAVVGGLTSVMNIVAKANDMQRKPNSVVGSANANTVLSMVEEIENTFYIDSCTIPAEYAQTVDDYFTRYGYNVSRFKRPNMTTHTNFNFVKTADCDFYGDIPQDHLSNIVNAFNRGVTLWHTNFTRNIDLIRENRVK